jgi:protein SCO1/2
MTARGLSLAMLFFTVAAEGLAADSSLPPALREVRFDQKLNAQVPLDIALTDETERSVTLAEYCHDKPVILVLAYFRCPMLCDQVLNGLVRALLDLPFDAGKEFDVIVVSFDARETPAMAAAKKQTLLDRYGRPGAAAGWHLLTGTEESIRRLTDAVGFRYSYDAKNDQFAHAAGIVLLTPAGKVSRYFYDVRYSTRDLRLGLVEASANRIGSLADQVLLYCFHYDPQEGKYGPTIMNLVRLAGILTVIVIGSFVFALYRRDRQRAKQETAAAALVSAEVREGDGEGRSEPC